MKNLIRNLAIVAIAMSAYNMQAVVGRFKGEAEGNFKNLQDLLNKFQNVEPQNMAASFKAIDEKMNKLRENLNRDIGPDTKEKISKALSEVAARIAPQVRKSVIQLITKANEAGNFFVKSEDMDYHKDYVDSVRLVDELGSLTDTPLDREVATKFSQDDISQIEQSIKTFEDTKDKVTKKKAELLEEALKKAQQPEIKEGKQEVGE